MKTYLTATEGGPLLELETAKNFPNFITRTAVKITPVIAGFGPLSLEIVEEGLFTVG